jgi:hypothetical protein
LPLKDLFKRKYKNKPYRLLDGYQKFNEGYTENPFAHYETATATVIEGEYYLQWVVPLKLNRIALRTPVGFRFVYLYAKDLWNNRVGIKIPHEKDRSEEVNNKLTNYLLKIRWFQEMEKLTAYEREQGEAILLCYYGDTGDLKKYKTKVSDNDEILRVEAFSPIDYHIPEFDKYGDPKLYRITVKAPDDWKSTMSVDVHPSRVLRKTSRNLEYRFHGYPDLASIYDNIVILSTIVKAAGEAAFRWGTGHPTIFTKDLIDNTDMETLRDAIGDFSRRSWHVVPTEKVDRIEMLGQAGAMLNLKALADICIDQIVIGSEFPKNILLGEISGIMGSEVSERGYFALLDRDHTDLEPFIRTYFKKDLNIRKLLNKIKYYELDWGIREVFNKMDEADYRQKTISNALALTTIATINECRKEVDLDPIPDDEGGDVILGLLPFMEMEMNMLLQQQMIEQQAHAENQEATTSKEKARSTDKQVAKTQTPKSPSQDSIDVRTAKEKMLDALNELERTYSVTERLKVMNIYDKTFKKLKGWAMSLETP